MVVWQLFDHAKRLQIDRKHSEPILHNVFFKILGDRNGKGKLPQANLDRHLPGRCDADKTIVRRNALTSFLRKLRMILHPPKKRVRIEEKLHFV